MVKLVLLGVLSDWAEQVGTHWPQDNEQFDTPDKIRQHLQQKIPALAEHLQLPYVSLAVNQKIQHDWHVPLKDADEVAFMPPFTGG